MVSALHFMAETWAFSQLAGSIPCKQLEGRLSMVDPWKNPEVVPIVIDGDPVTVVNGEKDPPATIKFGDSVPLRKTSSTDPVPDQVELVGERRKRNIAAAVLAVVLSVSNYLWQFNHPVSPLTILAEMQEQSAPLTVIGRNEKPTVVDFWAPWCENCRIMAPTLQSLEKDYGDRVNFVSINANEMAKNRGVIERFGVDAIPHLALVSKEGDVETALIGIIPKHVLSEDLDDILQTRERKGLPYVMLDVFKNNPEARRISF